MRKYIFGPVPSRRLGMSLGIDIVPAKVCSLDCVYCEVGKTTNLSIERDIFFNVQELFAEIEDYFNHHPDPDYITFSGSGEPTLNAKINDILAFIKDKRPHVPVAILTNGTLLSHQIVRSSIMAADLVLPSLDAATEKTFKRINRPHKSIDLKSHIQGLIDFRQEYSGMIYLEVFILPGYNDNIVDLLALKDVLSKINPEEIHLNTLDRPGLLPSLRSATREELERIRELWAMENIVIISSPQGRTNLTTQGDDALTTIMETISRRPCTLEDLTQLLGMHVNEVNKYLRILEEKKQIETFSQDRGIFYKKSLNTQDTPS